MSKHYNKTYPRERRFGQKLLFSYTPEIFSQAKWNSFGTDGSLKLSYQDGQNAVSSNNYTRTILQHNTMTTVQPTNMFSTTTGDFYENASNVNGTDAIGPTLGKDMKRLATLLSFCDRELRNQSMSKTEQDVWFDILLPLVCAIGIVGNIFTIVILSQMTIRTSTITYLIALASADLMFLVVLGTILVPRYYVVRMEHPYGVYAYAYGPIFLNIALLVSIWLTVAIAVERYITICHPLQAPNMCTIKRARYIIVFIYILAVLCRASNFWEYDFVQYFDICTFTTITLLQYTDLSWNTDYLTVNAILVDSIISAIIPFFSLFLLNICLIYEVRKSSHHLSHSLSSGSMIRYVISKEEVQVTVMLISIVIAFFICVAPQVVYSAIASINSFEPTGFLGDFEILRNICQLLLAIKGVLNFILYCWFSEKFWKTFKMMFCMRYCIRKFQARKVSHSGQSSNDAGTRETTSTAV